MGGWVGNYLARAGRAIEEDTFRWVNAQVNKPLGVEEGKLNHLPEFLEGVFGSVWVGGWVGGWVGWRRTRRFE